jgi:hypothetical protein
MKARIEMRNAVARETILNTNIHQVFQLDNDLVSRLAALVQDRAEELTACEIDEDHTPIDGALDEYPVIDELLRALFTVELQQGTFTLTFTKQIEAWDEDHAREMGEEIADGADIYLEEVDED